MNKKHTQKQEALVKAINETYKVGDKIKVRMDDGNVVEWTMKHRATMLGGHTAVIWAEEHPSCYSAERIIPMVDVTI